MKYDYLKLQNKWTSRWQKDKIYNPDIKNAKDPYYCLYMFPYPSAEGLHTGHAFSGTGADVYARYIRMSGRDVFQPMGFDAFGIHSENYALKINDHPQKLIDRATKHFREQFDSLGFSYDWDHSVNTSSPEYYKWTQWIFVKLFEAGLAEKKKAEVNWCPSCKTVLADEQVLSGRCERCNTEVIKKELEQWFFKITKYADRLLKDIEKIDWTKKVTLSQENWIGRSEGTTIKFPVSDSDDSLEVFTTRPDTLFGATFMVVSPKHPIVISLLNSNSEKQDSKLNEIREYVKNAEKKIEDTHGDKDKTGVFSGIEAINPATKKPIPIWIADYVLMEYGTGAIMAVPAHDERDFEFAKKYDLDMRFVLEKPSAVKDEECYTNRGQLINSGDLDTLNSTKDMGKILDWIEDKKIGKREVRYHLRDWLISRQRYWGAPIPMINCEECGWQSVPVGDLPVKLPYIENFKPIGTGEAPLSQDKDFINVKCPKCDGPAKRETDVADTFLDSSWYYLRYPSVGNDNEVFNSEITKKWLPVDMYIGGAEHSVLHLLYSRFITKALFDLKLLDFEEPFSKFRAHGLIIKGGTKMSKSKGNVVNPDEYIEKYGADALRCYLMFLGPFEMGGDFRDSGIEGMERFLKRVKIIIVDESKTSNNSNEKVVRVVDLAVKGIGEDIENLRYNTAIAKLMTLINVLYENKGDISKESLGVVIKLLAPFAPFLTEELWEGLGNKESVHVANWPEYDPVNIVVSEATIAVQVNGKLRDTLHLNLEDAKNKEKVDELAKKSKNVAKYLENSPKKVIFVPGKIINFVI